MSTSSGWEIVGVGKIAMLNSLGLQYFSRANARIEEGIEEAIVFSICYYFKKMKFVKKMQVLWEVLQYILIYAAMIGIGFDRSETLMAGLDRDCLTWIYPNGD
jgi:hypothetical protein